MHPKVTAGTERRGTWGRQRVRITLATGIPEAVARRASLGYRHPNDVDVATLAADANTLVVPDAGEVLYRLR